MVDIPESPLLKQVVVDTYERQAVVGAVCHGPVALLNAKLREAPTRPPDNADETGSHLPHGGSMGVPTALPTAIS